MKKNIIYLVLVVVFSGALFFLYNENQKTSPGAGTSQKKEAVRTIYVIDPGGVTFSIFLKSFVKGLESSHEKGAFNIVYKDAAGDKTKLAEAIDEAISKNPALIATISTVPTVELLKKSTTIPVLTALGDPVEHGYIKSLQGSEKNVAGIAQQNIELTPKRIELLKKSIPSIKKIAVVYDTTCAPTKKARVVANAEAPKLGVTLVEFPVTNPSRDDLEKELKKITRKEFDAIIFYPHGTLFSKGDLFTKRSVEEKLPIIMPDESSIDAGAFATYGPNYGDMGESLVRIANKVLNGVDPGTLPFEQPSKIDYVVSTPNARALGLNVIDDMVGSATKVIN